MWMKWMLPALFSLLSAISLLTLRSVAPELVSRQLMFFIIGAVIFWAVSQVPFFIWLQLKWPLYGLLLAGLATTQIVGRITRGTRSWIPVGSFNIQPSQLAVPIVSLLLAAWIASHPLSKTKNILLVALMAFFPALFIVLEPDLGTTIIYLLSVIGCLWIGKIPLKWVGLGMLSGVVVMVVGWQLLRPYQKDRLLGFLQPASQSQESSAVYHAQQSMIAVGSGGLVGRGLGEGIQSHLRFLPERQTDFVFASWAEETGLLGTLLVISTYFVLLFWLNWLAIQTESQSRKVFLFATTTMILSQIFVNIGMNIGILPITGITLPLISYGGSSILSLCFHLGVVQSLVLDWPTRPRLTVS